MALSCNIRYISSFPYGVLKTIQAMCGLLAMITYFIMGVYDVFWQGFIFFTSVAILVSAVVFLIINILNLPDTAGFNICPCLLFELIQCCLWMLCSAISFICAVVYARKYGEKKFTNCMTAIAVFMGVAFISYFINALLLRRHVSFTCTRETTATSGSSTVETRTTVEKTY